MRKIYPKDIYVSTFIKHILQLSNPFICKISAKILCRSVNFKRLAAILIIFDYSFNQLDD